MGEYESFSVGAVAWGHQVLPIGEMSWVDHQVFKGVHLKHLLKGEQTAGKMSCHLVSVDGGCEIGVHVHKGQCEVHEVLSGKGICKVADHERAYLPGVVSVIPPDTEHVVRAGSEGLLLFAVFSPPLL